MENLLKTTFLLMFHFLTFIGIAQNHELSTSSKKALQFYDQALSEYNNYNYNKAIIKLDEAIKKDENFIEPYLLKAQISNALNNNEGEIESYENAFALNAECYLPGYYYLAIAQLNTGKYFEARDNFNKYLDFKISNDKFKLSTKKYIKQCDFAIHQVNNPVSFNPVNLGDSINTELDEYWPTLSVDELTIVFTRLLPRYEPNPSVPVSLKTHHEDLYFSYKINNNWAKAKNMGKLINSGGNEGTQSLSVDGKYYFYTACNRNDSYGGCDIYYVEKKENTWSKPVNVGKPVNSRYKETQPAISSDGQTLFFVSNRPGGKGKLDIWKCSMSEEGYWQEPINLGDSINTTEDDGSPYLHPDGETLYFSSKGHLGMGNADVFIAKMKNNSFCKIKNLGYPINTFNDEQGLYISSGGTKAFFSSNREENKGKDIYMFDIYKDIQPNPVTYVKGYIADAISKKRLLARIELIELESRETKAAIVSDQYNGTYLVCLPTGNNYALNVSKRGYLFHSENFSLKDSNNYIDPFLLNVELQPIMIGSKGILKNIFFEIDSYELKKESYIELDKLIMFLKNNPQVEIEVSGHTDSTGEEAYNQELSEKRAKSVYDYLANNQISTLKITFKGYGSSQPIDDNKTKEGRAKNRRTEFKITRK